MAADQGDAEGERCLAYMHVYGLGVERNEAEALRLSRLAADKGHAAAQNDLGSLFETGTGTGQDFAAALKWYRLAARSGVVLAARNLGLMHANGRGVPRDPILGFLWFALAARWGDREAAELRESLRVGRLNREHAMTGFDVFAGARPPLRVVKGSGGPPPPPRVDRDMERRRAEAFR